MKVLSLLCIVPFALNAQTPVENKTKAAPSQTVIAKSDTKNTEAKAVLESYRQRVLKGESMAELAKLYSEDPGSAPNGGRYDNVVKGMMVPEFEKAAFSLEPNGVSEVFETNYGFHFIRLIAKRNESVDLQHILILRK
jgi:peptidyl-prolyl cis-trans isomerase SurA